MAGHGGTTTLLIVNFTFFFFGLSSIAFLFFFFPLRMAFFSLLNFTKKEKNLHWFTSVDTVSENIQSSCWAILS